LSPTTYDQPPPPPARHRPSSPNRAATTLPLATRRSLVRSGRAAPGRLSGRRQSRAPGCPHGLGPRPPGRPGPALSLHRLCRPPTARVHRLVRTMGAVDREPPGAGRRPVRVARGRSEPRLSTASRLHADDAPDSRTRGPLLHHPAQPAGVRDPNELDGPPPGTPLLRQREAAFSGPVYRHPQNLARLLQASQRSLDGKPPTEQSHHPPTGQRLGRCPASLLPHGRKRLRLLRPKAPQSHRAHCGG